jgi:hypothetical protein
VRARWRVVLMAVAVTEVVKEDVFIVYLMYAHEFDIMKINLLQYYYSLNVQLLFNLQVLKMF